MNSVSIRRATPDDAALVLAWREEPSAGRYQPLGSRTLTHLGERFADEEKQPINANFSESTTFIVEAYGEPAGWVTLREVDREHRVGDIGYTIGEAFRKRGLATLAIRQLLPIGFEVAALERLQAVAAVDNVASRRALARAGFQCEGIARAYLVINDQRVDHARYALLREEWRRSQTTETRKEESP
jgi:ribosomal-protein-alanine N-acetyltransferase